MRMIMRAFSRCGALSVADDCGARGVVAAAVAVWQLLTTNHVALSWIRFDTLPSASAVAERFAQSVRTGDYWLDLAQSLVRIGTGFAVAILASVMNNLPATLVGALAIDAADVPALTRELMIYANVVGNDLGPKFTPIGSLATLLWLHVLAGKGQRITWGQYMKVGLILTPPVLLAALVALWIWLPLAH